MSLDGAYGYFVRHEYPHEMNCLTRTPDESLCKTVPKAALAHRHTREISDFAGSGPYSGFLR